MNWVAQQFSYPTDKQALMQGSYESWLVALADVFDALTSKRPYKEAWSIKKHSTKGPARPIF